MFTHTHTQQLKFGGMSSSSVAGLVPLRAAATAGHRRVRARSVRCQRTRALVVRAGAGERVGGLKKAALAAVAVSRKISHVVT